ncbi:MAG: 1-deoxy-D-xylulose-5-phosphate reductoisomerase, partial [Candidatus Riflemargulisbacteria bacterium]
MNRIIILGSTGTIGLQSSDVIEQNADKFKLIGLSCHNNIKLFRKQLERYSPLYAAISGKADVASLKNEFPNITFFDGISALNDLVSVDEYDMAVVSIVGIAALVPTMKVISKGKDLAIASKEVLVAAGHLVYKELSVSKTTLYPIDSEHVAISLCMRGYQKKDIKNIVLTASGGPFWNTADVSKVTIKDALNHPNWAMGKKISIDSATMINKGLEVIEAHWLFGQEYDKIKVIIHPQSIVHGMVEYVNGAMVSQLSVPDMRMPILYALSRGEILRYQNSNLQLVGKQLDFFEPDLKKFKGLALAYEAGILGGSNPAYFNSANEEAVSLFLNERCSFLQITELVDRAMSSHSRISNPSLEVILEVDREARAKVRELC